MQGITRRLAEFALGLEYGRIPARVVQTTKEQLVSILGAIVAGADTAPGR